MSLRDKLRQLDPAGRALPDTPRPRKAYTGAVWADGEFELREHVQGRETPHGDVRLDPDAINPAAVACLARTPEVAAHPVDRWVFLDTETTGLSGGAGTVAFLVGLGMFEAGSFVVRQYLMRDYPEEPAMLAAVGKVLREAPVLVTYNGKTFDVPLLCDRFTMHRRRWPAAKAAHLDLLHTARRIWRPRLGSASLGTIEHGVFGVERVDDLPGSLIPGQYFRALREQTPELLEPILAHNVTDILSLAALAVRVSAVGENPLAAPGLEEEDLVYVGRSLEAGAHGDATHRAAACYERAAASCVAETADDAVWRLAMMAKRRSDWDAAETQWRRLVEAEWSMALAALEELAKLCEHRRKDFAAAAQWCRRALQRVERTRRRARTADVCDAWEERFTHRLSRVDRRRRRVEAP